MELMEVDYTMLEIYLLGRNACDRFNLMKLPARKVLNTSFLAILLLSSILLSGCAAAMVAGGLVGGYFVGQNMDVKVHQR